MKKVITIMVPVFNEQESINFFLNQFDAEIARYENKYNIQYLFLDNCSTDSTFPILNQLSKSRPNIRLLSYSRNYGVMKSIYTGIITSESDGLAIFDCDLQDPPTLIHDFINEWEKGHKFIYGKRAERTEGITISSFRKLYKTIESRLNDYPIEVESGAWFLSSEIVKIIKKQKIYDPYLPGLLSRAAYQSKGIEYKRRARKTGSSKFGFFKYLSYSRDGLLSGTITPLRLSIFMGGGLFISSFISAIYFILAKFYLKIEFSNGIAAILILTLFLFSFVFLIMGIMGEYIGRIYLKDQESVTANIIFDSKNDFN